jgi:hypothetical protein
MGADSMLAELDRHLAEARRSLQSGIISEGESIMARSKAEFVPKDEKNLEASGQVTVEGGTGSNLDDFSVVLSYGDDKTAAYALTVHETPSGYDPPTWQGKEVKFTTGGAKYLERPLFEAESGMLERIAGRVKL